MQFCSMILRDNAIRFLFHWTKRDPDFKMVNKRKLVLEDAIGYFAFKINK